MFISMLEKFPRNIIVIITINVTPIIPRMIINVAIMNSMYVIPTDLIISKIFEKLNPSLNCLLSIIRTVAIWER